jgi:hypothetical protein
MAIFSGIVAAIGSAFTAVSGFIGGLGAFGTFALKTVASFGVSLFAQRLGGNDDPVQASFGVSGQIQTAGDVARSFMLGLGATAGSMVYHNTWGVDNGTPNAFYTRVVALSDWPVAGLAAVWVNGEKATLDTANPHPQYGFPVMQYRTGGQDYCWVKFYDGTQTVADSFLTTRVSSAQRPYQTTRVGTGVAYAICTARTHPTLWTGWPTYLFVLNGIRLYDVTKDSTQGGSGPQRWSDPSTWGGDGDHLPAVQAYNLLKGLRYGSDWFYGLQGLSQPRLPSAHWRAQIAKCRALIAGPNGMEPTYRAGAEIEVSAPLADAIEGLNTASSGRLAEIGGIYKMHVGAPDAPVFSFDDGFILSSEEQSFTPFFGLADTVNGVTATHPSPAEGWKAKAAPPLYNATYEAEDGNRRLPTAVPLDFVSYDGQVQRLMKSALAEARRARRHTFSLPSDAWILEPGDTVEWSSSRNGYVDKLFRVDGVVDRANLDVLIDITEVDPTDYNWNQGTDYRPPVQGPVGPVRPAPQAIVDWFAAPSSIKDTVGVDRRPAILLAWDGTVDDVVAVQFEVRLKSTQVVIYRGRTDEVAVGSILISQGLLPATTYEVRGRYIPTASRQTLWSGWLEVITPNIRLTVDDVDFSEIEDFLLESQDWLRGGVRGLIESLKASARLTVDQDFANYRDKQQLRTELRSSYEQTKAEYKEEVTVATGPGSALANRLETLETVVPEKASVTALDALTTRVTSTEGSISAQGSAITAIDSELDTVAGEVATKASASAVSALDTRVTSAENVNSAQANLIQALNAALGGDTAAVNVRASVLAAPSGYSARYGIEARVGGTGAYRTASFFIDVPADAGQPTRITLNAGQIVLTNGSTVVAPFVFQGNTLYLENAKILQAQIENLLVGTSNIEPGAITQVYTAGPYSGSGTSMQLDLTVNHGANSGELVVTMCGIGVATDAAGSLRARGIRAGGTAFTCTASNIQLNSGQTYTFPISQTFRYTPPAGNTSTAMSFIIDRSAGGITTSANSMNIIVQQLKR